MRDIINKGLTTEELVRGVKTAWDKGWKQVKLYCGSQPPTLPAMEGYGLTLLFSRSHDRPAWRAGRGRDGHCGDCPDASAGLQTWQIPSGPLHYHQQLYPQALHVRISVDVKT